MDILKGSSSIDPHHMTQNHIQNITQYIDQPIQNNANTISYGPLTQGVQNSKLSHAIKGFNKYYQAANVNQSNSGGANQYLIPNNNG